MKFTEARLESALKFHRFHEELNRVMKVNVISLALFKQQLDSGLSVNEIKQKVYETQELWGGMPAWTDPYQQIESARHDLGNNGVVRVFSAFDVFMDSLEAELESWNTFIHKSHKQSIQNIVSHVAQSESVEDFDKFFRMLDRKGWKLDNEQSIKAVYAYYRLSRNCIAHRNGVASKALEGAANDDAMSHIIEGWQKLTGNKTAPPIQKIKLGELIKFTHRDAIFASSITRQMALNINEIAFAEIGEEGLVYLTAKKYIIKNHLPNDFLRFENVSRAIAVMMNQKGQVSNVTQHDIKPILQKLGIFDECKKQFKKMKV